MLVKVKAAKRGTYVQSDPMPQIIRTDPDGVDEAKNPVVDHRSVPELVRLGLIKDPGDLSKLEREAPAVIDLTGADPERFQLHQEAAADAGTETITPLETRGTTNFPPNQNVDNAAVDGLATNDPDAPPPAARPRKAAAAAADEDKTGS
jgi:hypothetical protein